MTIKDAEKLTGLTAKSIRFYESKGLINVERNETNDYRNYSENDIRQLMKIKTYRYFGFSIEEIKELLQSDSKSIIEKIELTVQKNCNEEKNIHSQNDLLIGLTKSLKKSNSAVEEFAETINFLESDELKEIGEIIDDIGFPSLHKTIYLNRSNSTEFLLQHYLSKLLY